MKQTTTTEPQLTTSSIPPPADPEDVEASSDTPAEDQSTEERTDENTTIPVTQPVAGASLEHWRTCWDDAAQNYYYFNVETQETTWTNPYVAVEDSAVTGSVVDGGASSIGGFATGSGSGSRAADPISAVLDKTDRVRATLDAANGIDDGRSVAASDPLPPGPAWWEAHQARMQGLPVPDTYTHDTHMASNPYDDHPLHDDDPSSSSSYTFSAHFNKKTGKFQPADAVILDPRDRFSQTAKAERQCGVFFDYGAWVEKRGAQSDAEGKRREGGKAKTKKEIEAFKTKRKDRKLTKQKAWLLD